MDIYLIPIFCFGLLITGIVFLGLQQASDMAKQMAVQRNNMDSTSSDSEAVETGNQSCQVKILNSVRHD